MVIPGAEVIVGVVAFTAVLGLLAFRARARRRASGANQLALACDPLVFSKEERADHHALAKNVFLRWPTKKQELPDGYLLHYEGDEMLFANLAKWASSEHRCCSWASFSLEMDPFAHGTTGAIRLRMTGGTEGKTMIAEGMALLEHDPSPFLNPTGKITKDSLSQRSKPATGCGC
ncbi:MAG TPA: hypothetical protein VG963_14240 [Polyangiaceae bacterium]|nr:hypothetical protein [Polyangiaceae bacterium]